MFFHSARLATEKAVSDQLCRSVYLSGIPEMQMTSKMTFAEQIKHPNWQRKRLEVLEAADFECENCGAKDVTLNVHHKQYIKGRLYWEYQRNELECLCEDCHKQHHAAQDGLKELLAGVSQQDAFALLSGFHRASDWIERETIYQGREANALAFAAGFVAYLTYNLDIDQMDQVAAFAASLMNPQSEGSLQYKFSGHIFGKGD